MKILSKTISERTSQIVGKIEKTVHLPIVYYSAEDRPNKSDMVAGAVDTSGETGKYLVYLDQALQQEAFETNVLHELRHILQTEAGFSTVCNKNSLEFCSTDKDFVKEVGSHLASVVLDIEVNRWLNQMGYSPSFFVQANLRYLINNSEFEYTHLDDPLNFANLVLALLSTATAVDDKDATQLYDAYHAYPQAVETTKKLRDQLLSMPLDNPISTCLAHCILVDELGLWAYYYVAAGGRKVRTHQEYLSVCKEVGSSPDK